jgi:hypothetical protein
VISFNHEDTKDTKNGFFIAAENAENAEGTNAPAREERRRQIQIPE